MIATEAAPAEAPTQQQATTPIKIKKIGHVVYAVGNMERSVKFWTEILGFKVSDRNEKGMVFLRNAADHHTIGLKEVSGGRHTVDERDLQVEHWAMEVGSMRELLAARDFLREQGVEITFEGRKGPGCNPGVEFKDPDGYLVEIYCNMDQIGWDDRSRPSDQWRRASSLEEAIANPVPGVSYF